ncbi:MAG: 4-hydroxy-tetrahydrodipicolinate reductase [Candidatus Sumerlaeia bacterium]
MTPQPLRVLMSGLPGRMAAEAARRLAAEPECFEILPVALTGPETDGSIWCSGSGLEITLFGPQRRQQLNLKIRPYLPCLAVDFSQGGAVIENTAWFAAKGISCVVGTTGGDRQRLEATVKQSAVSAVIAPNMAAPIVMLQAAMEYLALSFPGALKGWRAAVRESHQQSKTDVSGTARAMIGPINRLGMKITPEEIEMVRDPKRQRDELGVPEEHLGGHAYHTYTFTAPDNSVTLAFTHNVHGRAVYAEGAVLALRFLNRRVAEGRRGQVFSMIDVLKNIED